MAFRKTKSQSGFDLLDVKEFGKALHGHSEKWGDLGAHFGGTGDVFVVRAPARLDLMGGIANYSGALVCESLLDVGVVLGIQRRKDRQIRIRSANAEAHGLAAEARLGLDDLCKGGKPISYDRAHKLLAADAKTKWAAHVAGAFCVLLREKEVDLPAVGANIAVAGDIPWSVGLGASAAIEVAAVHGLNVAFDLGLAPDRTATLARRISAEVVGEPDGVMNHLAIALGQQHCLLPIRCQPDCAEAPIRLPDDWAVVAVNSTVEHQAGALEHLEVRTATAMGHRIIVERMRADGADGEDVAAIEAYLCNMSSREFKAQHEGRLPTQMAGHEFLRQYGKAIDAAAAVDPETTYRVRSRTGHPIYENERAADFLKCIERSHDADNDEPMMEAGRLMYGSHWSYRTRCGLDCMLTNFLVRMARNIGIAKGIYGAKITGTGLGGTVALLGRKDTVGMGFEELLGLYQQRMRMEGQIFSGTSPGAIEFGYEKYKP